MVSTDFLESELDGLAHTPTASDLGYKDSDLRSVLNTEKGVVELTPEQSSESPDAWLRTNTENFVFITSEWL